MKTQNQIKRILTQPEAISHIRSLLDGNDTITRTGLSAELCAYFGFHDPRSIPQKGGCLKALRDLERSGHFVLPVSRKTASCMSPRRLSEPVAMPQDVPDTGGCRRRYPIRWACRPRRARFAGWH
jgi:hypothetical protein